MLASEAQAEVRAAGLVVYRIVRKQIEYLLLHASYEKNLWTPPKGHVDPGESEFETAIRETEEETGLKNSDFEVEKDFIRILKYDVRGKPKKVTYWLAKLIDATTPIKLSEEHRAFEWLPLVNACKLSRYVESQELLNACEKFIQQKKEM